MKDIEGHQEPATRKEKQTHTVQVHAQHAKTA